MKSKLIQILSWANIEQASEPLTSASVLTKDGSGSVICPKCNEISLVRGELRCYCSYLTKWATERVLKGIPVKKFRSKDIVAAQNHSRAIKFVRRMASTPKYNITEADIKNIHFMIQGHLILFLGNTVLMTLILPLYPLKFQRT